MEKFIRGVKRMMAALLATALLVTGNFSAFFYLDDSSVLKVQAASSNAITYEYYTVTLKNTVPVSWLFVGTYLMSARGVTPQIYQQALKSRDTYEQHIAFYTSELDSGQWKNIKDASNIDHITPASGTVTENDLFPYLITCVVGDDGVPRDPESGNPISIFSTPDPYEMENVPELDKIEAYYNDEAGSSSDASDNYRKQYLSWFFDYDNLDTYDRDGLDVAAAYKEYEELSGDLNKLEDVWDEAMKLNPSNFPSEYKDLMMVMRNFPNVRDKVTDKADEDLSNLDTLFLELSEDKSTEEADAVLYVSAQVDATRRAEIYYNLTENENLTGSLLDNRSDLIESLTLRREEINAEIMRLGTESEKVNAPMNSLKKEIQALQDENDSLQKHMDEETSKRETESLDQKLSNLEEEYAKMQSDFAPVEAEYNRLDEELEKITEESVELDDEQTELTNEIASLKKSKKTKEKDGKKELAKLQEEIDEKTSRFNAASARSQEYSEGLLQLETWQGNMEHLQNAISAETTHYDALKKEAEGYTSSRLTQLVNSDKIYDPDKKLDLDHQVELSKRSLDAMSSKMDVISSSYDSLKEEMDSLGEDLALGDELVTLEKNYEQRQESFNSELSLYKLEADAQIEELRRTLAEKSAPFQKQLKLLQEANEAFTSYEKTYLEEKGKLLAKERELTEARDAKTSYDQMISDNTEKIASNSLLIESKEGLILTFQPAVDLVDGQIQTLQDEVDALDELIVSASSVTNGDKLRREMYGNTRDSISKRIDQIMTSMKGFRSAQAEVMKNNSQLIEEKKICEAAPNTYLTEYNDAVSQINTDTDKNIEKLNQQLVDAQYQYEMASYFLHANDSVMEEELEFITSYTELIDTYQKYYETVGANNDSRTAIIEESQAKIDELKSTIEQEETLRETRLEVAKQLYDEKILANREKLAQINGTMVANRTILNEYQSYVASTISSSLSEISEVVDTALALIEDDEPLAKEFGNEQKEYQKLLDALINTQTNNSNELNQLSEENEKMKAEKESLSHEVEQLKKEESELQSKLVEMEDDEQLENAYNLAVARILENTNPMIAEYKEQLAVYKTRYGSIKAAKETEEYRLKVTIDSMGTPKRAADAIEPYYKREQNGELTATIKEDMLSDAEVRRQMGTRAFTKWKNDNTKTIAELYEGYMNSISRIQKEADETKVKIQELEEMILNLENEINRVQSVIDKLEEENNKGLQEAKDTWEEKKSTKRELETNLMSVQISLENKNSRIKELENTISQIDDSILKIQDRLVENTEDSIESLLVKLNTADENYHRYDYVDSFNITSFGTAPTLVMMLDASENGTPQMGRKYDHMSAYRGFGKGAFTEDEELSELVSSAIEECQASYESYTKQAMSRGETAGDYTGFLMSRQVARNATDKDACMPYLQMIVDLTNIEGGSIIHSLREISLLEGYLIPFAMSDFTYEMTEERMNDYHYYIRALTERETLENAILYVENRLEYAYSLESTFNDANKTDLIQAHITWLENLLRALKEKAAGDGSDEEYDETEANLLEDRSKAIDEGDLKRAKKIDELLSKIKDGGGDGDDDRNGRENNPAPLDPSDIDPNNRPKPEQEIADLILGEIENPEYDIEPDLRKFVNVGGPLEDLEKDLEKVKNPKNTDAIIKASPAGGDGSGSDKSAGNGTDITSMDIDEAIHDALGHDADDASDEEAVAIIEALSEIQDGNPDDDLANAIDDLLNKLLANGCPYIYQQYSKDTTQYYVSMAAVDNCRRTSGFRYVKENDSDKTTMTQVFGGSASYTFTNGSKDVIKNNNEKDSLTVSAVRQTDKYARKGDDNEYTYLMKEDAKKFLYVSGRYVKNTDKAILITQGMEAYIRSLVEALEEKMMLSDE